MTSLLQLHNISHHKGENAILRNINLRVEKQEVVVILGPSGCGKSTLLRCINGLEPLSSGTLSFANQTLGSNSNWQQVRQQIGMVFQHYQLFPHLSVADNLLLAPRVTGKNVNDATILARTLLSKVGLADKWQAMPAQLSGGQQQRVAIARALVMQPQLMLFDEITAALDPEMVLEVLQVLTGLANDGMTMLIVTHELSFAKAVADRIIFMNNGQIEEDTTPQQFFKAPASARAQQFLSKFTGIAHLERTK